MMFFLRTFSLLFWWEVFVNLWQLEVFSYSLINVCILSTVMYMCRFSCSCLLVCFCFCCFYCCGWWSSFLFSSCFLVIFFFGFSYAFWCLFNEVHLVFCSTGSHGYRTSGSSTSQFWSYRRCFWARHEVCYMNLTGNTLGWLGLCDLSTSLVSSWSQFYSRISFNTLGGTQLRFFSFLAQRIAATSFGCTGARMTFGSPFHNPSTWTTAK